MELEKAGLAALQAARDDAFKKADAAQYEWATRAIEREEKRLDEIARLEKERAEAPQKWRESLAAEEALEARRLEIIGRGAAAIEAEMKRAYAAYEVEQYEWAKRALNVAREQAEREVEVEQQKHEKLQAEKERFWTSVQRQADAAKERARLAALSREELQALQGELFAAADEEGYRQATEALAKLNEAAEQNRRTLANLHAELSGNQQSAAPYASQIDALKKLRGAADVAADEVEDLLRKFETAQAKANQKGEIERGMSAITAALPLATALVEGFGIAGQEAAAAWSESIASMTEDIGNIALAVASGDHVGAIAKGLQVLVNWWNRNKRAMEHEVKNAANHNAQFMFTDNGYNTRRTTTHTTGFLFWQTTHYTEHIDELKKNLALSLEKGFAEGITSGFKAALAENDFGAFASTLRASVGDAVMNGLIEAFLKDAVLKKTIGPAIEEYLQTSNVGVLEKAVEDAVQVSEKFFEQIKPIHDKFTAGGESASPTAAGRDTFGSTPNVAWGAPTITLDMPAGMLASFEEFSQSVQVFRGASETLGKAAERMLIGQLSPPAHRFNPPVSISPMV